MSKRIKLTQSQFAIVDDKNYEQLCRYKWYAWWNKNTQSFYALRHNKSKIKVKRYTISMAREILELKKGDKREADHRNHKTLDNCESNLRIVTCQQNDWNRKNTKGYCWHKAARKYQAQINLNGKIIYLGLFNTTKKARNAYLKAKEKYHKI